MKLRTLLDFIPPKQFDVEQVIEIATEITGTCVYLGDAGEALSSLSDSVLDSKVSLFYLSKYGIDEKPCIHIALQEEE